MFEVLKRAAVGLVLALIGAGGALAGPPYLSDDPQPTDQGRWEIYNFVGGEHDSGGLDGEAGFDLNYGAARDLQLTAVLPAAYDNPSGFSLSGLQGGTGVVELAAKYKFLHQDPKRSTPDVAVFPRVFIPTNDRFGTGHASLFLPVWAQKDFGPWQVFGGGGYQINPGAGQRDFWQGGVAVNRVISKRLQLGVEVYVQGADEVGGYGRTAVNFAATYKLVEHWSLLASAGPTTDGHGDGGQVFYLALKADY